MERIKSLCRFVLCASLILLVTTFIEPIYPHSMQITNAYSDLMEQYQTIATSSSFTNDAFDVLISEEEFEENIPSDIVKSRALNILTTSKYAYMFTQEEVQEISEQFVELYEHQQLVASDYVYQETMYPIQLSLSFISLISIVLLYIFLPKEKPNL